MEEQMLFENLDEKLEDELAVITTTWLSINFELPIGEAEGLLNKYFTSHPHLSAVFLLTGLSSDGEVIVRPTPNEKLKESEAAFVEKPARTIYSVQRHPCRSSTTVATSALFSDISTDALKKLVTIPWCPTESSRQPLASCENKQNEIGKQPGIPVASSHSKQIEKPKPSDISNFFTTTSKPSSTTLLQKQGQKRPSTFFDTKPGKKVSPKKTIPEKPAVLISKSTDQEEEEEEFLTSAVLRSSKRKRLIFDSDEEEATTDPAEKVPQSRTSPRKSAHRDQKTTPKATKKILAADSETDSPTPKPARGRRPRSGAAATETEREAPIAPLSRESRTTTCSPKKPQASKPKSPVKTNRRRRQVLKTFMDDDGYMVTEKVWESTSENDEEPDEPIRAVHLAVDAKPCVSPSKHDTDARLTGTPTMGSTKSAQPSKKSSRKITPKAGTKQASISSFFSRT